MRQGPAVQEEGYTAPACSSPYSTADKCLPLKHLLVTHLNNASHRAEGFTETRTNLWHGRLSSSQQHNKWIKDKNWARALVWGRSKAQSTEVFLSPKLIGWTTTVAAVRCPWKQRFLATVFYSWCVDWNHIGYVATVFGDFQLNDHEKIFSLISI